MDIVAHLKMLEEKHGLAFPLPLKWDLVNLVTEVRMETIADCFRRMETPSEQKVAS